MDKVSASSPKKGLKILIIIAIISSVLFGVVFSIILVLRQEKSMYADFAKVISDPYEERYIESGTNLNPIKDAYKDTLVDFTTTSSNLQERLSYYLPYLLHLKFDKPTQSKAKKVLNEFTVAQNNFDAILKETKIDSIKETKNPYLYYGAFLPQYQKYIKAKYDIVRFIENYFENIGFSFSPYLNNLVKLANLYVKFSINIALPSIYVINDNPNNFNAFISDNNSMSLKFLNNKFLEFKNTFKNNVNQEATKQFNIKFSSIEKTFRVLMDTYYNLSNEKQTNFLKAEKKKPTTLSASDPNYETNFLLSYFATNGGKFVLDANHSYITTYFNF